MFRLDDNLLQELGLGTLPPHEKNQMLRHIYETLEMRVGIKLAEQMTNEQLDEFESFIDRNDEPGALKWLESNFPNYKQVVADELEKLKSEIKSQAPQIVAASQAAGNTVPQQPQAMPQPASAYPAPNAYQQPPAPSYQPMPSQPPVQPSYGQQPYQPAPPQPAPYVQPPAPQSMPPASPQPFTPAPQMPPLQQDLGVQQTTPPTFPPAE